MSIRQRQFLDWSRNRTMSTILRVPLRCLTISMTILRSDCLCFLLRFWKMSQLSSCRSLKPTARWWFSSTDESLYIRASSESEDKNVAKKRFTDSTVNHLKGKQRYPETQFYTDTYRHHIHACSRDPCWAMQTHWCWWGTDWKLQGDPHHGWRWQTEQRGSPDQ